MLTRLETTFWRKLQVNKAAGYRPGDEGVSFLFFFIGFRLIKTLIQTHVWGYLDLVAQAVHMLPPSLAYT